MTDRKELQTADERALADLPGPASAERFEIACKEARTLLAHTNIAIHDLKAPHWAMRSGRDPATAVATAQQFIALDLPKLDETARKAARPANKREIIKHVALLIGSMAGQKVDMKIFTDMLVEDVGALQPSIGGLEAGFRHLRRTATFVPSIAECLTAIKTAEERLGEDALKLAKWSQIPDELTTAIEVGAANEKLWAEERETERVEREARRVDSKADIRRRLEDGKSVSGYMRDLVDEVLAEMEAEGVPASEDWLPAASHVHARKAPDTRSHEQRKADALAEIAAMEAEPANRAGEA